MKKAAVGLLIFVILLLDYAALDDITTGSEPSYIGEYLFLAFSIVVFGLIYHFNRQHKILD